MAVSPAFRCAGALGIVAIRTFLSFSLETELHGALAVAAGGRPGG